MFNIKHKLTISLLYSLFTLFALISCNEQSDDLEGLSEQNTKPTSIAADDISVNANELVTLVGQAQDAEDNIIYQGWLFPSDLNFDVDIIDTNTLQFYAPFNKSEEQILEFTYIVEDQYSKRDTSVTTVTILPIIPRFHLNDTGIKKCADYAHALNGSTNENSDVNCELAFDETDGDIIPKPQDGHIGLDALNEQEQGFKFVKLDNQANELPNDATQFYCVKDEVTGLIWESKTFDENNPQLRDKFEGFTWYESDESINSGDAGDLGSNTCVGYDENDPDTFCNTQAYRKRINDLQLCGLNNWRIPTKNELLSIIDYSVTGVDAAVNLTFFPNTHTHSYWTINSSANIESPERITYVYFNDGSSGTTSKDTPNRIRLVHDELSQ